MQLLSALLVLLIPNTAANHAIIYTNTIFNSVSVMSQQYSMKLAAMGKGSMSVSQIDREEGERQER